MAVTEVAFSGVAVGEAMRDFSSLVVARDRVAVVACEDSHARAFLLESESARARKASGERMQQEAQTAKECANDIALHVLVFI